MPFPVIDAHQHFWDRNRFRYDWLDTPAHRPIAGNFLPEDLLPHLAATSVEKTVFVQVQHDVDENRWVLSLADQYDFIAGVVGWVDLASPACEDQVREFRADPRFVGVRHIVQDEPDDDFIVRPEILAGLKVLERHGVPYDLLFYVKHLKHAQSLGRMFPDLPLVIDHLAKPRIREHALADWLPHFEAAAACPNIYCKLSGMVTEAAWHSWSPRDLATYVETALECFGPRRLMFGSDWPVCELAASYEDVYSALDQILAGLSTSEREQIFGRTASEFYRLPGVA